MKSVTIKKLDKHFYEIDCDGIIEELILSDLVSEISTYLKNALTKQIYNQIESYLVTVILRLSELEINDSLKIFPEDTVKEFMEQN